MGALIFQSWQLADKIDIMGEGNRIFFLNASKFDISVIFQPFQRPDDKHGLSKNK